MESLWKTMADDSRREILLLLRKRKMTLGELAGHFQFTPPALSSHLRILKNADLITEQKLGKNKTRLTLMHSGFTGKEEGITSAKQHSQG